MKKRNQLLTLFCFSSFYLSAGSPGLQQKETVIRCAASEVIIIHVPFASEKNHADITQKLSSYKGVAYVGKCLEQNFYFLRVDRNMNPDNQFLKSAFDALSLNYEIKIGTPAETVMNSCGTMIERIVIETNMEVK